MTRPPPTRSPTVQRPFWFTLCLLLSLAACDIFGPEVCHTGIFYEVDPQQVTLEIGASFTPTATIETCPEGRRELPVDWVPEDPDVLAVEGNRLTAMSAGETTVEGRTEDAAPVVMIAVTVVQP